MLGSVGRIIQDMHNRGHINKIGKNERTKLGISSFFRPLRKHHCARRMYTDTCCWSSYAVVWPHIKSEATGMLVLPATCLMLLVSQKVTVSVR